MWARRMVSRILATGAAALLVVLLLPAAGALAAPSLAIESPTSGQVTKESQTSFTGHTSDSVDPVTVKVYNGEGLVESESAQPEALSGAWSLTLPSKLADGKYTAVAEQTELLTSETAASTPIEFTIDTAKPVVTLNSVASPSNDSTPAFSGSANEKTTVTVLVFKGSSASGSPVAEVTAGGTGAGWTSGSTPTLSDGTYTAVAEQESSLGNGTGFSQERTFTISTAKPVVTLNAVPSPSNDNTPSFSGAASEKTTVTVYIFAGGSASGSPIAEVTAGGTGGGWSSGAAPTLADGTYTAVAGQESSLGNGTGYSQERTFVVDTAKPVVTLNSVPSPGNDNTPSFSGTASEKTTVTVYIFAGGSASGSPVATVHASGTGGGWSSGSTSTLSDGTYTAVAAQESSLGNGTGYSQERTFTISTAKPVVTLNSVPSPSNDSTPSFSGTASDTKTVTVYIFAGGSASGSPVAEVTAGGTGGGWSSGPSTKLPDGTYTAVAGQESSLGNGTGFSPERTFTISTAKPVVTLNAVPSPSNDNTPSFSGTASDKTTVRLYIFAGGLAGGSPVAEVTAPGTGGGWSAGPSTTLADGTYTAIAAQESSLGNPAGTSQERTFVVDTAKPVVTLNSVPSPSNDSTPSFSGTANEKTTVTISVFKGASAGGSPVATVHASGTGGGWSSGSTSTLSDGTYTAVAAQESSLGNGTGYSQERTFVVDTAKPTVELHGVPSPSNNRTPTFSGYASETTNVTVRISGNGPTKEFTTIGTGGGWVLGPIPEELSEGTYKAVAVQESVLGNGLGESNQIEFEVKTASPKVTLNPVKSPSGNTTPSFTGTANESNPITIQVHSGAGTSGPIVASAQATGTGGGWSSGKTSPALVSGEYTAVAEQASSYGNPNGESGEVRFVIDTSSPVVTLGSIPTPSNDTTPTFSGTATDTTPVVVRVYNSADVEVSSASGGPSAGKWKSGGLSHALATGSYTAVASEASSLGNPAGISSPIGFVVNTESPHVTLNQPATRSSDTTPTFAGTATDTTTLTVEIFRGASASGTVVSSATAGGTGGAWASNAASPALENGTYTAVALQKSSLGNPEGSSEAKTFQVDTKAPNVTLTPPASPSNNRSPAFSGTVSPATETSPVVVHVLESGHQIREVTAIPSAGAWSTAALSTALGEGRHEYKVYATEESSIGNGPGRSEELPLIVDTTSPVVKLEAIAALSNNTTPTFKGTATDTTPVTVDIYAGSITTGTPVATATAPAPGVGGAWTSAAATPALPSGAYSAVARQASSLGNPAGESAPKIEFHVETSPPVVTLLPPATPSNNRAPSFSGTASVTKPVEPVVVHVLEAGKEVASATATPGEGGQWKAGPVTPQLAAGEHPYTAYATQLSSLGNPEGKSAEAAFVVDTNPPKVTMEAIATPSNNASPVFSGTASDTGSVTLDVYRGKTPSGPTVAVATAPVTAKAWTSGAVKLPPNEVNTYVAVARQKSSIGNEEGTAQFVFVVAPKAPTLHMNPIRSQIDTATPTFSGTSSEPSKPVTVDICEVPGPCGAAIKPYATATSPSGGVWSTGPASPPLHDGVYQAVATQLSLAGELGATLGELFTVDTHVPVVTVTSPSSGAVTTGSSAVVRGAAGTAPHDVSAITVQLFRGSSASGATAEQVEVGASNGAWAATLTGLLPGVYTVRAEQPDEAGNVGVSPAATFTDQSPPAAVVRGPAAAFTWYPSVPHTGETVSLASSSTDASSPITGYAWNLTGSLFRVGAQTQTTSFATPGSHLVQLRITDSSGLASVASERIPVTYPLMRPFPVVRIVTTRTLGRVRLRILSVQAPVGASVSVSCTGRGCPLRSMTRLVPRARARKSAAAPLTFAGFERSLAPGIVLQIRVTQPGRIGKFTSFAIRRGRLPVRSDACLEAVNPKPVECPA